MGLTSTDYLAHLQALLPPGPAWSKDADAPLTRLLDGLAQELARVDESAQALLQEVDPRQATVMLPDWERALGLPDTCTPAEQELLDRQRSAHQRLVEQGGQSRAYFIGLAELLGEPGVSITEFPRFTCNSNCNEPLYSQADLFAWRVNIPHPALSVRRFTCNSQCDAALQSYTQSVIECVLNARKPAHTNVIFAYTT